MKRTKKEIENQLKELNHKKDMIQKYITSDLAPFDSLLREIVFCDKTLLRGENKNESKSKKNELILSDLKSHKSRLEKELKYKIERHNELESIVAEARISIEICREELLTKNQSSIEICKEELFKKE